jgi:hypothetical protein
LTLSAILSHCIKSSIFLLNWFFGTFKNKTQAKEIRKIVKYRN